MSFFAIFRAAQNLRRRSQFFLFDFVVFLFFCNCSQSLPRKMSFYKIDENVTQRFNIISPTLFAAQMRVQRGVSGSACQAFVFFVRNVIVVNWIAISFCKTEIDNVNHVAFFAKTHQKIVRLDVAMDEVFAKHCSLLQSQTILFVEFRFRPPSLCKCAIRCWVADDAFSSIRAWSRHLRCCKHLSQDKCRRTSLSRFFDRGGICCRLWVLAPFALQIHEARFRRDCFCRKFQRVRKSRFFSISFFFS